jgi:2'-5' RNA ligase
MAKQRITSTGCHRTLKKSTSYLVELRLSGTAKKYVKNIVYDVAEKFHVSGVAGTKVVPHVTIIGPIKIINEQKLVHETIETCMKYDPMTIKFSGFTSFGNWLLGNRVLAIKIEPSKALELLRIELIARLCGFCQLSKFDKRKWRPHATIAFKILIRSLSKSRRIWKARLALKYSTMFLELPCLRIEKYFANMIFCRKGN